MRRALIFTIAIVISICFVISSHAFFNSDVKKAKEYIQSDMYPQVICLLSKRIKNKPLDANAHFVLGICHLHQGNIGKADQGFDSAVKQEPRYEYKMATELQKDGNESLDNGKFSNNQHP